MNDITLTPEDRVLIIGATGFIGSRLITELLEKSIKLRLLVRNPSKLPAELYFAHLYFPHDSQPTG